MKVVAKRENRKSRTEKREKVGFEVPGVGAKAVAERWKLICNI